MFWGLVLKANKKYSQTVQKAFHLSQAALDLSKCGDADVQVMLTSEDSTYLLCTLGKKTPQVALDLNFDEGDQISLSTKGEGVVHLTGYLMPNEEDLFGGEDDEDLEEEEDEEVEASPQKGKGKERIAKKVAQKVNAKEVQLEEDGEEDELDETFELPTGANKKSGAKGAVEEEDSDDDDDDEDDEDDDDDDEDMDDSKLDGEEDSDDDDDDESDDDEEDDSEDEQPKAKVAKVEKKASKQNGVENGKASPKEQKKEGQQQEAKTRTLQGGLVVEDLKVGSGQEAKPGKKVAVFYEGRLKKNNKVFDSTNKGPGFKFALGRGEVIKGWDLGVSGMKVGGKRRLTVPHQLAYGTRGSPPVIPPNSTLVFDVELKNVF
ncbi:46 kDa FK506-binding nuclear protein-like [Ochlerotatus camptorhynchus]|uniref:46 kDa FK506-binding nuclear protein-like n=1 Tax=Ochlerotatus camptorhynchus TaxID=644619 RepID=UPI0031D26A8A